MSSPQTGSAEVVEVEPVDVSVVVPGSVVVGSTGVEAVGGGSKDVGPPLMSWLSEAGMETSGSSVQAVPRDRTRRPTKYVLSDMVHFPSMQ
jgi:hypothetical protein